MRSEGATLEAVYTEAPEHPQLYDLAEAMVDWDEALRAWRYRHLAVVERFIGDVIGTQGTPVDQLRKLPGALAAANTAHRSGGHLGSGRPGSPG